MPEPQPSSQQKRVRSGRQSAREKLAGYRTVLQHMHDLLLAEGNLEEVLHDERRVPTLKSSLSTILAWIKTVEDKKEIISSFINISGDEIERFKENIEMGIYYMTVVLDVRNEEKKALEKKQIESFSQWRIQAYKMLAEGRRCIYKALLLFK